MLVTGAGSGIGEAVATRLVHEGHHVVVRPRRTDRTHVLADRTAEATRRSGGSLRPVELDVTDRASVAAFVDEARRGLGRVDVFVNNAGVMPLSRLDALLVDEWDRMIDVNVRGLLHGIAAALPVFATPIPEQLRRYAPTAPTRSSRTDRPCGRLRHRQPADVDVNDIIVRPARQR